MTSRCPPNSTIQSLRKNHDLRRPGPGSVVLRGWWMPTSLFSISSLTFSSGCPARTCNSPAAKKVIYQPEARARDPVRFPRWRVGLICSSMRNFLAGVIRRVELQELSGYTSTLVLGEVAHRLMTLEASARFGWPSKIVDRLKQNPATVQRLVHFRSALQKIPQMGIQVLTI